MSKSLSRWIIIPDLHAPYHDARSLAGVEQLMADYRWDGYLNIGDFLDLDCISSHNFNNLRAVESKRILSDYKVAAEILDRHQAIIRKKNKNARFVWIEGNHSHRITRFIDANPALEGLLEIPTALELKRRGVEWIPYWSEGKVFKIGKATFLHGRYVNDHHAKKHVQSYNSSVLYGHVHDIQAYSAVSHGETFIGQSLGHLCLPQKYMQGRPDRWQQAVTIFEFLPDGNFQYQVIRISNHKFSYNNKIYQG